jgi:hypothetical protein
LRPANGRRTITACACHKGSTVRTLANAFKVIVDGEAKLEAKIIGKLLSPVAARPCTSSMPTWGRVRCASPAPRSCVHQQHHLDEPSQLGRHSWLRSQSVQPDKRRWWWQRRRERVPGFVFKVATPLSTIQALAVGSGATPRLAAAGGSGAVSPSILPVSIRIAANPPSIQRGQPHRG